jgi:hypothetical protein
MGSLEDFGAYLVLRGDVGSASAFLHRLIKEGLDPLLVSPCGVNIPSDTEIVVQEPEGADLSVGDGELVDLLRSIVHHLSEGEKKAVVIFGLQALNESNEFHDLTNFIDRLYEEACVNQGLVIIMADPKCFTRQELAFMTREATVLEGPEQLFI